MLKISLWVYVGVFVWGFAFCNIQCPDGTSCSDLSTCCQTAHRYECCPYPKAVCCADKAHCCPEGFTCNLEIQMCMKENQSWLNIPMVKKEASEVPSTPNLSATPLLELKNNNYLQQKSTVVHCDNFSFCPDGTTCCRHPKGGWFCCPYSPGRCCLDGYHCCPYGFDCDHTYTYCVRGGLRYPFSPKQALTSVPASLVLTPQDKGDTQETPLTALTAASSNSFESGVIRCDNDFYCPIGSSCCKGPKGQWNCCPYQLGMCCADGLHCCQYGYTCNPSSSSCSK